MAPEIAFEECASLDKSSVVLDPMVGSGTTLYAAVQSGCQAIGFDLDPLAILMTVVRTTSLDSKLFLEVIDDVTSQADRLTAGNDGDPLDCMALDDETREFIRYWFAGPQQRELAVLAKLIGRVEDCAIRNALYVTLSRIIITKERGASLARDVSHSRPHKVLIFNDFRVIDKYRAMGRRLSSVLATSIGSGNAWASIGDARKTGLSSESVDLIITSPPYLNAIDYLRGHKLALVWMGYTIGELRRTRSSSVGSEKGATIAPSDLLERMRAGLGGYEALPSRQRRIADRYLADLIVLYMEQARVLKVGGRSTTVIGNSSLRGAFLRNDQAVIVAAEANGLSLSRRYERELPPNRRYLPPPTSGAGGQLDRRVRTETVVTFEKHI
jgi:hypothetical protein